LPCILATEKPVEERLERTTLPTYHFQMVKDTIRNNAFHNAIKNVVKPGMHVLDIGTGTGLLSMMSVQAGASLVTTCEKHITMHSIAQEVLQLNGYSNRVNLFNKHSYDLKVGEDMPEKADLLVCEIIDSFLLGEWMLPTINHAKKHLLKVDPVTKTYNIIPKAATITAQLLETNYGLPLDGLVEGFNLSPFRKYRQIKSRSVDLDVVPHVGLSDAVEIHSFNFQQVEEHEPETFAIQLDIKHTGSLNAVALWWNLNVDDKNSFVAGPRKTTHWSQGLVLLENDVPVYKGETVTLTASHNTTYWTFQVDKITQ